MDANLITPNMPENQKPQSLRGFLVRSDNPSLDAKDVTELAFIMIDMPQLKAGEEDTEAASSALINGDPRSAHDRLLNTIHEADLCDEQFAGSSNPLPGFYKAVHASGTLSALKMKKSLISLTLIFVVQIILLPIIHCRIIFPMDAALVDQTCKQTPNFDLCETLLRSDPRSLNAEDAKGLASIMVDIVQAKATKSMDKINDLLNKSPVKNQALFTSCIDNYNTIIDDDIPQASEAFSNDDNITAEDRLKDITFEVDLCDKQFSGLSNPLKDVNKDVHDAASIAAAIADKLP
ncbi:hypothetical protein ACFX13_012289 [Malus domestica]